jgi:T1SS-143 domain-containing protein
MKVDTFTVMAFDGTTKQISFTIHGTNDATVIGDPAVHDVTEDTNVVNGNLTASGTLSISDADQTQASFQTGVTGAQGNLGSLTLQTNGSYTYTVANSAVQFLGVNDMKVDTFTVMAFDGTTKQISVTIHGTNDAPVITSGAAAVVVSEEGLPNGVPDTLPDILDTTNSTTANGTITASDADGDPLTMTLGAPNTPLTSGGVTIAWTLQNGGHTLVGKAGATTIITATITDAGTYTVTLTGSIDHPLANQEDNKTFAVPVTVSDGHTTTPTTLSVTIEDDSPKAEPVEVSVVPTDSKTNVMVILDLSGSMDTNSGRRRRSARFWISTTTVATSWCGSSRSRTRAPRLAAPGRVLPTPRPRSRASQPVGARIMTPRSPPPWGHSQTAPN